MRDTYSNDVETAAKLAELAGDFPADDLPSRRDLEEDERDRQRHWPRSNPEDFRHPRDAGPGEDIPF